MSKIQKSGTAAPNASGKLLNICVASASFVTGLACTWRVSSLYLCRFSTMLIKTRIIGLFVQRFMVFLLLILSSQEGPDVPLIFNENWLLLRRKNSASVAWFICSSTFLRPQHQQLKYPPCTLSKLSSSYCTTVLSRGWMEQIGLVSLLRKDRDIAPPCIMKKCDSCYCTIQL